MELSDNDRQRIEQFFLERIHYGLDGCWYWTGATYQSGYGYIKIYGRKPIGAHRFSFEYHKHPIPPGKLIMHSCDNPLCVNPDHLFVGTDQDNTDDFYKKGRTKVVKKVRGSISESDVEYIRMMKGSMSGIYLAAQFNISVQYLYSIQSGRRRLNTLKTK